MKIENYILLLYIFSILCACGAVYFFMTGLPPVAIGLSLVAIIMVFLSIRYSRELTRDLKDFTEAVRYRDFSRKYSQKNRHKQELYQQFNTISNEFFALNQEKEIQQQYLKKILELVDTGILAYDVETHDTLWMNESIRNMLAIPMVKNIDWLKVRFADLYHSLLEIPNAENRLLTFERQNQMIKTLTNACTFQTDDKVYKLVAFHNVSATLEEVEANAWKRLLSVMTHEIMNSIAPVVSLADTLKKRIEGIKSEVNDNLQPDFEDIEFAMETIRRRSEGLMRFADTYRSLSKTIVPQLSPVNLEEVLSDIYQLMIPSLKQKGIQLEKKEDQKNVVAIIDRNLIEQVVINFITNATYAVKDKENPQIILISGINSEGEPFLSVADNGVGISPEIRDKIFVPFFSTKKSGSGIGLSLSREIVHLHKGTLFVRSKEGEGTVFTVYFPDKAGIKN